MKDDFEVLSNLLIELLRFYKRKSLKEIKEIIDSKFQVQVQISKGGNKKSKSNSETETNTSISSSSALTSMPISKTSEISKSENGIFFVKVSEKSVATEIEPSLFKYKQFNKIDYIQKPLTLFNKNG